jgi:hypothetical protein
MDTGAGVGLVAAGVPVPAAGEAGPPVQPESAVAATMIRANNVPEQAFLN